MQQFPSPPTNFPNPSTEKKPNQGIKVLFFILYTVILGYLSFHIIYLDQFKLFIQWPFFGSILLITEGKSALLFTYIGSTLFSAIFLTKRFRYTKRFLYTALTPLVVHFFYFMVLWDFEIKINPWFSLLIFWITLPVALTFLTLFILQIVLREE